MDERETALFVLNDKGYLSKSMLARKINCSLIDAAKVIESLLPLEGVFALYSKLSNNKVEIMKEKVDGSVVYALSKLHDKREMYLKELEDKEEYYKTGLIVYPPAASGIYLQEKREIFRGSCSLHSSTVKQISKNSKPLVVRNSEEVKVADDHMKIDVQGEENKTSTIEKVVFEAKEIKRQIGKEKRAKQVKFGDNNENTPAHEIKVRRKGTPFPNDKNLKENRPREDFKGKEEKKKKKKDKGIDDFYVPTIPVVLKRKVIKTRSFYDGEKMISEDYSSEEEIVINRTPIPIPKRNISQSKLTFK